MKFLFSAVLLVMSFSISAQSHSKLWEKLYNLRNKSFTILNHTEYTHPYKDSLINEINISPTVCNSHVYCWIAGTGRLYQLTVSQQKNISGFKRIDSTHHTGNNYDALLFEYNHELYSLGGYGFWRRNGQLKVFDTLSNDWQIIPLNKEIPVAHSNTNQPSWYDSKQGKVFLFGYSVVNEAEGIKSSNNDVMQLDLKSKEWSKIGTLSTDYLELFADALEHSINKFPISIVSMPWGILVRAESNSLYLLDINNNEIKQLGDNKKFSLALSVEKHISHFYADSFYYAYDPILEDFDSLKITKDDFKSTGIKIYKSQEIILIQYASGSMIILSLIGIFTFLFQRKKKSKKDTIQADNDTFITEQPVFNKEFLKLDTSEINILELLLLNGKQNQHTTIDDLNKVLGLTKKNINIQKKQRSDLIISLNRKLSFLTQQKEDIIIKKRNQIDKRSFDYYIDPTFMEVIMKYYINISASGNS